MIDSIDVLEAADLLLLEYSGSPKAKRAIMDLVSNLLCLSVEQTEIELQEYRESH